MLSLISEVRLNGKNASIFTIWDQENCPLYSIVTYIRVLYIGGLLHHLLHSDRVACCGCGDWSLQALLAPAGIQSM